MSAKRRRDWCDHNPLACANCRKWVEGVTRQRDKALKMASETNKTLEELRAVLTGVVRSYGGEKP